MRYRSTVTQRSDDRGVVDNVQTYLTFSPTYRYSHRTSIQRPSAVMGLAELSSRMDSTGPRKEANAMETT
ncbi:MAG: hypothetical protein AAGA03_17065, partial [Planctomycetota bacterium]